MGIPVAPNLVGAGMEGCFSGSEVVLWIILPNSSELVFENLKGLIFEAGTLVGWNGGMF